MITTWIQRKVRTALAAAVLGALGVSSAQAQDIRFGYNADQSGTAVAELGLAGRHGFELAIEDLNKAGGILGRKVVGIVRDDTGAPPSALPGAVATSNTRTSQTRRANTPNDLLLLVPGTGFEPVRP